MVVVSRFFFSNFHDTSLPATVCWLFPRTPSMLLYLPIVKQIGYDFTCRCWLCSIVSFKYPCPPTISPLCMHIRQHHACICVATLITPITIRLRFRPQPLTTSRTTDVIGTWLWWRHQPNTDGWRLTDGPNSGLHCGICRRFNCNALWNPGWALTIRLISDVTRDNDAIQWRHTTGRRRYVMMCGGSIVLIMNVILDIARECKIGMTRIFLLWIKRDLSAVVCVRRLSLQPFYM